MIVVDTNVLAYLYLPGPLSGAAEALLERDPEWAAPPLWRSEFRNVLAGYLRRGTLDGAVAKRLQRDAESLLAGREFDVLSDDVLDLVRASDCSAYDCEFVALARRLGLRLVTMDLKLLRAFPDDTTLLAQTK